MSTLWTPSGEHQVPKDATTGTGETPNNPGAATGASPDQTAAQYAAGADHEELDTETVAAMEEQMRQAQEQLISVPSSQVVANHIIGFFELALLHLQRDPPAFDQARLPIDAMALLVNNLGEQLDAESNQALNAALQQIQMAFVAAQTEAGAGDGSENGTSTGDEA